MSFKNEALMALLDYKIILTNFKLFSKKYIKPVKKWYKLLDFNRNKINYNMHKKLFNN